MLIGHFRVSKPLTFTMRPSAQTFLWKWVFSREWKIISISKDEHLTSFWYRGPSNQRLSYAHRIMGSPGGKHWTSLQRNVWRGAVSPFKTNVFGQRMPHFAVILWEAEVTNVGALIVSFCGINAMKSIDKHSFLRKVDCEIYWMVSKYIVLTYQV